MLLRRRAKSINFHLVLAAAVLVFALAAPSLSVKGASSISQGFKTDDPGIVAGAIVGLKSGTANTVELSSAEKVDRLLGVASEDSLIELSDDEGTVKVITTGEAAVLVSDINGEVEIGDKITASPIAGVGMKAVSSALVIGTAQDSLSNVDTETRSITDKDGHSREVRIGAIPAQVDKVFYEAQDGRSTFVPTALQDFVNSLAGRPVSPIRIAIASIIVLFVFVAVVALLYSSIRSSIISIGRNPLSKNAVQKSLLQVGITVFGVMLFAVIVVYLVLTI